MNESEIIKKIRKTLKLTQVEFSKRLGITQAAISAIESGGNVSYDTIKKLQLIFNINPQYISSGGKGDMFIGINMVSESLAPYKNGKTSEVMEGRPNMIMVPLKAYGGFLTGYANEVFLNTLEKVYFPFIKGRCYGFEVEDYSMYKSRVIEGELFETGFKPNDWLACTEIEGFSWLRHGNNYVFQTIDGIIIKRFVKIENNYCYLTSINEEYNPVAPIYLKNIKVMYFVERKTTKP